MTSPVLSIDGTRLLLDGQPFYFQGLSFFNAIFNPSFNRSDADRLRWLQAFQRNGISALRIWCEWDFPPERTFVDTGPTQSLYTPEGDIREEHWQKLEAILTAMRGLGMVAEVTLFVQEKRPYLPVSVQERAARAMAERLLPHRDLILQIWNEESLEVARYFHAIKSVDPARLVTNSPGIANVLGDEDQNRMLDLLTPHTVRHSTEPFWEVAPRQIAALLDRFAKPVIDDEPARTGIVQYGGIEGGTRPEQHIAQIIAVRGLGAYHTYHHDMFQRPYGDPATPPEGLPNPDFSPFHRQVFDYLHDHRTW